MTELTFPKNAVVLSHGVDKRAAARQTAEMAVHEAMSGCSNQTREAVARWVKKYTGFTDLADMLVSAILNNYHPTIRPVAKTANALREADLVANAFDAACTWAFGAGTGHRAYRPESAYTFRPKKS